MRIERIQLQGRVQGVGMRPMLLGLARQYALKGQIRNDGHGVELLLGGPAAALDAFLAALPLQLPRLARLDAVHRETVDTVGTLPSELSIVASDADGIGAIVLPDAASCEACVRETLHPGSRRQGYAFTNCTHCGPRLSIQAHIPWDRPHTTMARFGLCAACSAEYHDAQDRRFHAQPIACPQCGPQCQLQTPDGGLKRQGAQAVDETVLALKRGQIVAIKGLGGFHLACDATNPHAIDSLRRRKQRPSKPLAIMVRDRAMLDGLVSVNAMAGSCLESPAGPIMLLPRQRSCGLPDALAPGLEQLGVMLPTTPLHHLLLHGVGRPLVMTSGNVSGEPPCIENDEALMRLQAVADLFLVHDRPILNRLDDSVVQLVDEQTQVLRLARGLAPAQQPHEWADAKPVLALGGMLKSSFALLRARDLILSQHIGDLDRMRNLQDYENALQRYFGLYHFQPAAIAVDAHPGYPSHQLGRRMARTRRLPLICVQHHHAHAVAVMAEAGLRPDSGPRLAVCFDGLGYGDEGELWGGELLQVDFHRYSRLGRWRPAALIGGDAAQREPARNLLAVLDQLGGWADFAAEHPGPAGRLRWQQPPQQLLGLLQRGLNVLPSSSVGRNFDALAALLGLAPAQQSYEAEAALRVQAAASRARTVPSFEIELQICDGLLELDWRSLWRQLLAATAAQQPVEEMAAGYHQAIAKAVAQACRQLVDRAELPAEVVLCGGVFQNGLLLKLCRSALRAQGMNALFARAFPAGDGGLALGQAWVAAARTTLSQPKELATCV